MKTFNVFSVDEEKIVFVFLGTVSVSDAEIDEVPLGKRNRPRIVAKRKALQMFDDVRLVEEVVDSEELESSSFTLQG